MSFKKNLLKKLTLILFIPTITLSTLNATNSIFVSLSLNKQSQNDGSISVTLTNSSSEPIKVLRWNTPLEESLSSNIFNIKNNHQDIHYKGRLIKRGQPTEKDYTLFEGGEKRTVKIDLSSYYKMTKEGNYSISYRGGFHALGEDQKPKKLKRSSQKDSPLILSFVPKKTEERLQQKISSKFLGCSQNQKEIINKAHTEAINMTEVASDAMNNTSANTKATRYVTWFGHSSTQRQKDVTAHFSKLYDTLDNKEITFDCGTCTEDGTFAYVYPDESYNIYLCGGFWGADLIGTDSQAGTLIHELSHFLIVGGTVDHVYGQDNAKELALNSPDQAVNNADNHEFFSENSPYLTMEESDNPQFDNAKELSSFPFSDNISTSIEKNFYEFIAPKEGIYTFYTTGKVDTIGKIYNKSLTLLIENDDKSNSNSNFQFSYTLKKNESYFITIESYYGETGEYKIYKSFKEKQTPAVVVPEKENENPSHQTNEIPSINYVSLFILFILSSLLFQRELKKIIK